MLKAVYGKHQTLPTSSVVNITEMATTGHD